MERSNPLRIILIGCGALVVLLFAIIAGLLFVIRSGVNIIPGQEANIGERFATNIPISAGQENIEALPTFTPSPLEVQRPAVAEAESELMGFGSDFLVNLYDQINPGVVSVQVNVNRGGQLGQGAGSGFLIDEEGHLVTNNHVVAGATSVAVTFYEGTQVKAEIVGTDADSDLAVLRVESFPAGVHPLQLGDSAQVVPGEWVVAIGNPFGLSSSMTIGIVSAVGRTISSGQTPFSIPQSIQTDAAINPGNSGGPLLNLDGQVIGVNAQIATGGGVPANAGVGFAIPVNIVRRITPSLIENSFYQWPWVGVRGSGINRLVAIGNDLDSQQGAYIDDVIRDGPADKAGMQGSTGTNVVEETVVPIGGDVIIEADGRPIKDFNEMLIVVSEKSPGDLLELTILRGGERLNLTIELEARPGEFQ